MYGQIHLCTQSLILTKFGADMWSKILEISGLNELDHFMHYHYYDDSITLTLIGGVVEALGAPLVTVLEVFGDYFYQYCCETGHNKMLTSLGRDLASFIQNLDSLHSLLAMTYKNLDAPSFRCETMENHILLHYYSMRDGLHHIVIGVIKRVNRDLFGGEVTLEIMDEETLTAADGRPQKHVTFKIAKEGTLVKPKTCAMKAPLSLNLSYEEWSQLFPYYLYYDNDLTIHACGDYLQRLSSDTIGPGAKLNNVFEIVAPQMEFTIENIRRFKNAIFIIKTKVELGGSYISLKGAMIDLGEKMFFQGSLRLTNIDDLVDHKVFLCDIPLYDVTRELILLNQQRIAEVEISKKLDNAMVEIKRTSIALEAEKKKTDQLLYQMLPENVANQLRQGKRADAEKFEQVTILFSDIVTFTNISAAVQPIQVVHMLNELYMRFDNLTNVHDVYKVETIGDAYMVVAGLPIRCDNHAQKVACMGLDMVLAAQEVPSPATGNPLEIRVGFHSGPVVAGVVGQKMPRYCLFGDTVNTSSRMESCGLPAKVHASPTAAAHLKKTPEFNMICRGRVAIKGKGIMETYFVLNNDKSDIADLSDYSYVDGLGDDGLCGTTPAEDKKGKLFGFCSCI